MFNKMFEVTICDLKQKLNIKTLRPQTAALEVLLCNLRLEIIYKQTK